jgi:hypothetical protein
VSVAVVLAGGCGESRPPQPANVIRVETHGQAGQTFVLLREVNAPLTCTLERAVGRLVIRNGCLLLDQGNGSAVAPLWPPGAVVTAEGGISVGKETARLGDWIETGGGGGDGPRFAGWPQACPTATQRVCGFSVWTEAEQVAELGRTAEEQARRLAAGLPLHEPGFQPPYQPPPLPGR